MLNISGTTYDRTIRPVFCLWAILWGVIFFGGEASAELKVFAIGTSDRPWETWGTLQSADITSRYGWMQPIRTSREMNILNTLYQEGRLFPGEKPIDPLYRPGDGRIWSPNAPFSSERDMVRIADGQKDSLAFDYFNRIGNNNGAAIYIDLGSVFPVSEIQFYPLLFGEKQDLYLKGYELFANDGRPETRDEDGKPVFHLLNAVPTNTSVMVIEDRFTPQHIRFLKLRSTSNEPFELDQIEVRGEGFIREATFTSKIIDLTDIANLGEIRWAAEEEAGASIRVQTRVGRDRTTLVYNRINDIGEEEPLTNDTNEANFKEWKSLPDAERGSVQEDTDNWTFWSYPYQASGARIVSEGPRRYVQLWVTLENTSAITRAMMDSIAFDYAQPALARALLGDIAPRKGVKLGQTTRFRYMVRPAMGPGDAGFDIVQIETPVPASVHDVHVGERTLAPESYEATAEPHFLTVRLLGQENRALADEDSVEVVFSCSILSYGTVFSGWASTSLDPGSVPQMVEALEVGSLSVQGDPASLGVVLSKVEVDSNPITPNGDGMHDEVTLSFKVFEVLTSASLSVDVYDLAGRSVRRVFSEDVGSAQYEVSWDGRDDAGDVVTPGVYLYRVRLRGDERDFVRIGTVAVVY